jgi:tRNA-dihydrouridine synthase 2
MLKVTKNIRVKMASSPKLAAPNLSSISTIPNSAPAKRVPIPPNGVDYRGKVVLAPMVRSGELPSRLLALKYGADLVWGPETIDRALIGTTRHYNPDTGTIDFTRFSSNGDHKRKSEEEQRESVIFSIHPEKEKGKLIYQIGTAQPETAVEAAKLVAADVAGIDLNSGCPKPFSTSGGMGAALLKDPDRLCSILTALVREVGEPHGIGISVKIRLLETPEKTSSLVTRLVQTGITGLTVHCRTTPMRPRERAIRDQLAMIGNICREAGVACLMNGDVTSRDEGLQLAREYGVDGAMIATAAEANPSVFRSEADGGRASWSEIAPEYLRYALAVDNRWANTKFTLAQLMPGKLDVAKAVVQAKTYAEAVDVLGLTQELGIRAQQVDQRLGLDTRLQRLKLEAAAKEMKKQNQTKTSTQTAVARKMAKVKRRSSLGEKGMATITAVAI